MSRFMLSSDKESKPEFPDATSSASTSASDSPDEKVILEDAINQVDQILCQAIQNPRECLFITIKFEKSNKAAIVVKC
ncbi:hypothetical protein GOBAR_AA07367 [Gossypium barbadense]|nr:hypothetical protein GOBAR_AA07367 [Gossypium barbadense]